MGFSIGHLLVLALVVILVFGTKRLRDVGNDLGAAIKSFRGALQEGHEKGVIEAKKEEEPQKQARE